MLIAVMGTGSGMALGFGTIFTNDIYRRYINRAADGKRALLVTRTVIVVALAGAVAFTSGNLKSAILVWGVLSMGLRGAVLFAPMAAALFLRERVDRRFVVASSVVGLSTTLVGTVVGMAIDPRFPGIAASLLCILLGWRRGKSLQE